MGKDLPFIQEGGDQENVRDAGARESLLTPTSSKLGKDTFNCLRFIVTGGGFMLDQYNLFILGTVMIAMKNCEYIGHYTDTQNKVVKALILVGAVCGQLTFGYVADVIGRRPAFLTTLSFVVGGAALSAVLPGLPGLDGDKAYWILGAMQFLAGFGVGGEYPLSASVSRESSPDFRKIGYTFCMQGAGFIFGPLVFLCLLGIFNGSSDHDLSGIWRGALAFSGIGGLLLVYPRTQMQGTYTPPKEKKRPFFEVLMEKDEDGNRNGLRYFLGTTLSWFLFDISFYGNSIMATSVFDNLGLDDGSGSAPNDTADRYSKHHHVMTATLHMLVIASLGLPGYFMSVATVKKMGLWRIQLFGFCMMAVTFLVLAVFYNEIKDSTVGFLLMYGLTFFFGNWGPNYTTFIVPTLLFDTEIRARAHGASAAAGKVGGAVGVYLFSLILDGAGFSAVSAMCAGVAAAGILVTLCFIPRDIESIGRKIYKRPIDWRGEAESGPPSPTSTLM
eukprot:Hpha_TRINITY_DN11150_c0_g1::TRINITY_DN11150_c0_g1_i1::g.28064::m.28064/K08176/PHO84; MFS transporter, PHS family, inorganic phosphate transporter